MITTVPFFVPAVAYVLVVVIPVPDKLSAPLQEYVYVPFPPAGTAVHVACVEVVPVVGETEQVPVTGCATTILLLQFTVTEEPLEVITTVPVFVPVVEYVLVVVIPVPERLSVPLQAYVYVPFPPAGTAVHVACVEVVPVAGETEQVPVTGCATVKVYGIICSGTRRRYGWLLWAIP